MYALLALGCVGVNVAGAVYLVSRWRTGRRRKLIFVGVALGSIVVKLILATRGHNYDVESYNIVGSLVLQGKSVYANTARYNYAPLWACLLAGIKQFSLWFPWTGEWAFHVPVATFLAIAEVTLAAILAYAYSYEAALFFLLSPVAALITGYQSQFENLALLAGLLSWVLIRDGSASPRRVVAAGILGGVSLVAKHVLFLFPAWVFFWPKLGSMRRRVAYAAIAYGLFGVSFLPWAGDPASRAGMAANVFGYRTNFQLSFARLLVFGHPTRPLSSLETTFLTVAWMAALMGVGIALRRGSVDLFPIYLLTMFGLSPGLADQHLAIPMLACAILYRSWPAWGLVGAGTVALVISPYNIVGAQMNLVYILFLPATQLCALYLLNMQARPSIATEQTVVPLSTAGMDAAALAFGSAAVAFVLFLVRL